MPDNTAATFLTHFFDSELIDEEYLILKVQAMANGDIRQAKPGAPKAKVRRRTKRATAILTEVTVASS